MIDKCTHCGSVNFVKNGSYKGVQKYKCNNCLRWFSNRPKKFSYDDKSRALDMYLNNVGIRKIARFMGCSAPLVLKWIKEAAHNLRHELEKAQDNLEPNALPTVIEMDEIYTIVKKRNCELSYGLLIVDGQAKLLRIPLETVE
jgi:transposase-like protein